MSVSTRSKWADAPLETTFVLIEEWDVDHCNLILKSKRFTEHINRGDAMWRAIRSSIHVAIAMEGRVPVKYTIHKIGRMTCETTVQGMQSIPYVHLKREIRAVMCANWYFDLDIVNCQPTILSQIMRSWNIDAPSLRHYINHRDDVISDIASHYLVDRDAAKNLIIRLVYLGGVEQWMHDHAVDSAIEMHPFVDQFHQEFKRIAQTLSIKQFFGQFFKGHDADNASIASKLAIFLQTKERECINALIDAVKKTHVIGAIIHDGILIRKEHVNQRTIDASIVKKWQDAISEATEFSLQLKIKDMNFDIGWIAEPQPVDWMDGTHSMTYDHVKEVWERCAFKAYVPGNYVVTDPDTNVNHIMTEKKLIESYRHLHFVKQSKNKDGTITLNAANGFIKQWISDPTLRKFKTIVLAPPPKTVGISEFNLWSEFAVQKIPQVDPNSQEHIESNKGRDFIVEFIHILCNRNATLSSYLLDWIAQIFQEPAKKRGIAVLLKGEEGIGKNCLTDLLREMIGRHDKFLQTANPSSCLFGRFTMMRENKFLIVLNESKGSDNMCSHDLIKDMITCDEFVCEGKNVNAYPMNCYARFMFTTNNDNVLKISPDDRRFLIIEGSSELKANKTFFDTLVKYAKTPSVLRSFYDFLMARDISEKNWIGDLPVTDFLRDLVCVSLPFEHQFIKHLMLQKFHAGESHFKSKSEDLFMKFRDWLSASNISPKFDISAIKFGLKISKLIWDDAKKTGFHGISKARRDGGIFYHFFVPEVVDEMTKRKWMSTDEIESVVHA